MKVERKWRTGNGTDATEHCCKMHLLMCDNPSNSRNIIARKDKPKEKSSVKWKLVIQVRKWKKLRMPIGSMNLASDVRNQRKKNSASQTNGTSETIEMCTEDDTMDGSMVVDDSFKVDLPLLSFSTSKQIQGTHFRKPLTLLLNSDSTATWTNEQCLPKGIQGHMVDEMTGSALAGTFVSTEQVCLEDFSFPDFHPK